MNGANEAWFPLLQCVMPEIAFAPRRGSHAFSPEALRLLLWAVQYVTFRSPGLQGPSLCDVDVRFMSGKALICPLGNFIEPPWL